MHALTIGFGLGFLVAMQVGPMSLFLIRSTLRAGLRTGLAIGAGIALVDGLYAACGAAGVTPLLDVVWLRAALGLAGAAVLLRLGVRTLYSAWRVRLGAELQSEIAAPRAAFVTSIGGTASNPATILSWAAIFAAARTAHAASATLLVAGVIAGSLSWVSLLATAVSAARRSLGARALRTADALTGLGLLGFGGAVLVSASHER